jgi:hypothetical protein
MMYVKTLGPIAAAAMALMAFLGAGSASATVLCKEAVTTGCTNDYPAGTALEGTLRGGTMSFEVGSTVLVTCTGSTILGGTENTGGAGVAVGVNVSSLTWSGCTKTTTTLRIGTLALSHIAGTDNASVTAREFEITISTIFGSCIYGYGTEAKILGVFDGGASAIFQAVAEVPKISGNCPGSSATWTAAYNVTNPASGFAAN